MLKWKELVGGPGGVRILDLMGASYVVMIGSSVVDESSSDVLSRQLEDSSVCLRR
jgi:hypothetical protein